MASLPTTDESIINECQYQLDTAEANLRRGQGTSKKAVVEARQQLAWALAHSRNKADVTLAIRMLQDRDDFFLGQFTPGREYFYTLAVAHYRAGEYLLCRDAVTQALELSPTCHQSLELRDSAAEAIARDGLIGLGVIGGAVAVIGLVASALAKPSRR